MYMISYMHVHVQVHVCLHDLTVRTYMYMNLQHECGQVRLTNNSLSWAHPHGCVQTLQKWNTNAKGTRLRSNSSAISKKSCRVFATVHPINAYWHSNIERNKRVTKNNLKASKTAAILTCLETEPNSSLPTHLSGVKKGKCMPPPFPFPPTQKSTHLQTKIMLLERPQLLIFITAFLSRAALRSLVRPFSKMTHPIRQALMESKWPRQSKPHNFGYPD